MITQRSLTATKLKTLRIVGSSPIIAFGQYGVIG